MSKFRATLEEELRLATRGVVVPVPVAPVTAGAGVQQAVASTTALSTANAEVATSATAAAASEVRLASAAQAAGAANRVAAKAAVESAAAHEQLARGAGATGLSLLGARGATLAAGSEFLVGAAAVTVLAKSIQGASQDAEALADVSQVLGDTLGQKLAADAQKLSVSLGIVDEELLRFQAGLAVIFKNVGETDQQAVQFSENLLLVARNLSSVKDVPVEDVFRGIQNALIGNLRGIRLLIGGLSAAEVRQRAMADSGKTVASALSEQELVLARYELILEKAARFSGAWAKEQDRLAGKSQQLKSRIDQLSDSLGKLTLPGLTEAIDLTLKLGTAAEKVGGIQIPILNKSVGDLALLIGSPVKGILLLNATLNRVGESGTDALSRIADEAIRSSDAFKAMFEPLNILRDAFKGLADATGGWNTQLSRAVGTVAQLTPTEQVGVASENITLGGIAGVGPDQQIALLKQRIAANQKIVAEANKQILLGAADSQRFLDQRRAAESEILADQNEIRSIKDQQAASAKADADASKAQADAAKADADARRRDHDQRIQDAIETQQSQRQIALTNAEAKKGLLDDIKAQIQLRNLIQRQIRELVPQIQDVRLRNQVLRQLREQEAQTKAAIVDLFNTRKQNREEAKKAAAEALAQAKADALEGLRLQVQIAEAKDHTQAQINALQRLINAEKKQLATMKRETNEKKQLRLQIAQDEAELKRLKGEAEKQDTTAKDFFSFLQRQQGFAATLLGNLFPASAATAAATQVAATAAAPTAQFPFGAGPGGVGDVSGALSAAAQTRAGAPRGGTAGQQQTIIQILRQILLTLQHHKRGFEHPEARNQRAVGSAVMDVM